MNVEEICVYAVQRVSPTVYTHHRSSSFATYLCDTVQNTWNNPYPSPIGTTTTFPFRNSPAFHVYPTPYTLHPTPYTLQPTPYTLHPTYTPHPTALHLHVILHLGPALHGDHQECSHPGVVYVIVVQHPMPRVRSTIWVNVRIMVMIWIRVRVRVEYVRTSRMEVSGDRT